MNRLERFEYGHLRHLLADDDVRRRRGQGGSVHPLADRQHHLIRRTAERLEARAIQAGFVVVHRAHRDVDHRTAVERRKQVVIGAAGLAASSRRSGKYRRMLGADLELARGEHDIERLRVAQVVHDRRAIHAVRAGEPPRGRHVAREAEQPLEHGFARRRAVQVQSSAAPP